MVNDDGHTGEPDSSKTPPDTQDDRQAMASATGEAMGEPRRYAWRAEDRLAGVVTGTLDGESRADVTERLDRMGLRVVEVELAEEPAKARPLGGAAFEAFNQQLALLTKSGMPVEEGLRLIASDMRSGRLKSATDRVRERLERGESLAEAFEHEKQAFPPLYAAVVRAGVKSGNLPAVLLNISRHWEMRRRVSIALRRALSYPLIVLLVFLLVSGFFAYAVAPMYMDLMNVNSWGWIYETHRLPGITLTYFHLGRAAPWVAGGLVVMGAAVWVWRRTVGSRATPRWLAAQGLMLPLVGPVLRLHLVARWCDALSVTVGSGLALPEALRAAGEATGSVLLRADSERIAEVVERGEDLNEVEVHLYAAPRAMLGAVKRTPGGQLTGVLRAMASGYEDQARSRLAMMETILQPILLLAIAAVLVWTVLALTAPLGDIMDAILFGDGTIW